MKKKRPWRVWLLEDFPSFRLRAIRCAKSRLRSSYFIENICPLSTSSQRAQSCGGTLHNRDGKFARISYFRCWHLTDLWRWPDLVREEAQNRGPPPSIFAGRLVPRAAAAG